MTAQPPNDAGARLMNALETLLLMIRERAEVHVDDKVNNMTVSQLRILQLASLRPGISQKDIAEQLDITPSGVSLAIREMEKGGWVERRQSTEDGRRLEIYTGVEGERLIQSIRHHHAVAASTLLDVLSESRQNALIDQLETLIRNHESGYDT